MTSLIDKTRMLKQSLGLLAVAVICGIAGPTLSFSQDSPVARIGVVNQDRVLNESDEGRRLKAELEKLRSAKTAAIEAKEKDIKGLQDQMQNAQLSLSEDRRDEIGRQLKRKRVEFDRMNDDATAEFQEAANRAQARLLTVFRDLITKYGIEKGYTVIFERNTMYYAASSVDISEDLLARFNLATKPAATPSAAPKN